MQMTSTRFFAENGIVYRTKTSLADSIVLQEDLFKLTECNYCCDMDFHRQKSSV